MRRILFALVFAVVAIRANPPRNDSPRPANQEVVSNPVLQKRVDTDPENVPALTDQEKVDGNHAIISSGNFNHRPEDHPSPDEGTITGDGKNGKSAYLSFDGLKEGLGGRERKKNEEFHLFRAKDAKDQGLEVKADGLNTGGDRPEEHVSVVLPQGEKTTPEELAEKMKNIRDAGVKVKGTEMAQEVMAKANKDPNRDLKEVHDQVKEAQKQDKKAEGEPSQKKDKKKKDKKKKDEGGGSAPTVAACKRDGSFCTLRSRPKTMEAEGRAASKKAAGNSMSRKPVRAAAGGALGRAAGPKSGASRKSPLAKQLTSSRTGGRPAAKKNGERVGKAVIGKASKTKKTGITKKGSRAKAAGVTKALGTNRSSAPKKAGRNKKAGPLGTTTRSSATRKTGKGDTAKRPATKMASAGGSKKQTFHTPAVSKGSSKAKEVAKVAVASAKFAKKIHRRDLTTNGQRAV